MDKQFEYIIVKETNDGVVLETSNGDSHYLTNGEYEAFKKTRKKKGIK